MDRITDSSRAQRFARALLSDVMLYNPDKVREGIQRDDLFERLREELAEARDFFRQRVDPSVPERDLYFDRAIVDVLIYGSRGVRSRIW